MAALCIKYARNKILKEGLSVFEIRHLAGILMLRDQEMVSFQVDDTWVDFEIITPAERPSATVGEGWDCTVF